MRVVRLSAHDGERERAVGGARRVGGGGAEAWEGRVSPLGDLALARGAPAAPPAVTRQPTARPVFWWTEDLGGTG